MSRWHHFAQTMGNPLAVDERFLMTRINRCVIQSIGSTAKNVIAASQRNSIVQQSDKPFVLMPTDGVAR